MDQPSFRRCRAHITCVTHIAQLDGAARARVGFVAEATDGPKVCGRASIIPAKKSLQPARGSGRVGGRCAFGANVARAEHTNLTRCNLLKVRIRHARSTFLDRNRNEVARKTIYTRRKIPTEVEEELGRTLCLRLS